MAPKRRAPKRCARQSSSSKYMHIHLYDTGLWGAWVREPRPRGKRRFLGSFLTEKLAARCQDRALIKLQMEFGCQDDTKLHFDRADYAEDEPLRTTMTTDEFLDQLRGETRGKYKKYKETPCLRKFMAEANLESDREPSSKRTSETGPKPKKQKCAIARKIVYSSSEEDYEDEDHESSEEEYYPSEEEEHNSCGSKDEDEDESDPEDEDGELQGAVERKNEESDSEDEDSDPEDEDDELQGTVESPPVTTPDPVAVNDLEVAAIRSLRITKHEDDEDEDKDDKEDKDEDKDWMEHGMNVFLFLATGDKHDKVIKEFLKTKKN